VRATAVFEHARQALVFTVGSALRPDMSGPGYWVLGPSRVEARTVVVNRGFLPEQERRHVPDPPSTETVIVGILRWPEPRTLFTPVDRADEALFFVKDHPAIAAAMGWGSVAPFYLELESPPAAGGLPRTGPVRAELRNPHLGYAITWYGLAVVLVVLFVTWWRMSRSHADDAHAPIPPGRDML
jgi:cytochrome oxidase assembly protein ShyY1